MRNAAAYLLAAAAAAFLFRAELRTDDSGVLALCVIVAAFLPGWLHPRRAWQWALLTGPAIPAADLYRLIAGAGPPSPPGPGGFALLMGFVIVLGLLGSYAGVLVGKAVASMNA
ncbi:MAG TPA: hypothetical protein VLX58_05025 [Bryobacteraceae bacterium]|nr:hypothetical protein [Bryobacteraceae bacterium]HUJ20861.1 hypothetical protein [Bryobacteraceae bacterium]